MRYEIIEQHVGGEVRWAISDGSHTLFTTTDILQVIQFVMGSHDDFNIRKISLA